MKTKLFCLLILLTILKLDLISQSIGYNYQASVRDSEGLPIASQNFDATFQLIRGSQVLFTESKSVTSNDFGIINTRVLFSEADMRDIPWGSSALTLKASFKGGGEEIMQESSIITQPFSAISGSALSSEDGINSASVDAGGDLILILNSGDEINVGNVRGKDGTGVTIVGSINGEGELNSNYEGAVGDMFIDQNSGEGYVWDGSDWNNVGRIQGPAGEKGEQGDQGLKGETGDQGPRGEQGAQGEKGVQGDQGTKGAQGEKGDTGAKGDKGDPGKDGTGVTIVGSVSSSNQLDPNYNGEIGDMVIDQSTGNGYVWDGSEWNNVGQIQGPKGDPGATGPKGDKGDTGAQGTKGDKGDSGEDGVGIVDARLSDGFLIFDYDDNTSENVGVVVGSQGPKGDVGSTGPKGDKGDPGPTGAKGDKGDTGSQGAPGKSVTDAIIMDNELVFTYSDRSTDNVGNVVGARGPQGEKGDTGAQGPKGDKGDTGAKGDSGDSFILTFGTVGTDAKPIYRGNGAWTSTFTTTYEITAFRNGKKVDLTSTNCSVQVTPVGNGVTTFISFKSGNLLVSLFDLDNKAITNPFFFTIYQF